jgi:hypothetical protein
MASQKIEEKGQGKEEMKDRPRVKPLAHGKFDFISRGLQDGREEKETNEGRD